ncbi:hypothetical protein FXO38_17788 [Capsicum annuum]|nr:hypothetical protein FXO37_35609 [Capsicum annuum]KAF3649202.1 hypothetical protein FXO38_17788 [Capsicum annuum]
MKKKHCVVQAQLCRCVMSREIKGSSSVIVIQTNVTSLHFTSREFAIITGLNCVSNRYDFVFDEDVPNRLKASGKFNLIQGMPLAIQVWLYECCLNVPRKVAFKVDNRILQLLNWKTNAPRPCFEYLMDAMFNEDGKATASKWQTVKQIARINFPLVLSKSKSPVEEEVITSKKVFEAFRDQEQCADTEYEQANIDDGGLETSGQHYSPDVVQNSDKMFDVTNVKINKEDARLSANTSVHRENELCIEEQIRTLPKTHVLTTDEQRDESVWPDSQNTISGELLPSLNV